MKVYEDISPRFKNALIHTMKTKAPFWSLLGMELVDVKKGWAKVKLPFAKGLSQPLGIAHGGAIFSPADSAIAIALLSLIEKDETITTVEMKINYIKPFKKGEITAEAEISHKGHRTALGEVIVKDNQNALVAKGTATYMIMKIDT